MSRERKAPLEGHPAQPAPTEAPPDAPTAPAESPYEPPAIRVVARFEELTLQLKISGTSDGVSGFAKT